MSDTSPKFTQGVLFTSVGVTLLLMLAVVFFAGRNHTATVRQVKVSTGEWAPYTSDSLPHKGVISAIVARVLEDMGYQSVFYFMPWPAAEDAAALQESNTGIRATFPYSDPRENPQQTDSRSSRFYFSDSLLDVKLGIFYHRTHNPDGASIEQPDTLGNHILIKIQGYEYPPELSPYLVAPASWQQKTNTEAFDTLINAQQPLIVIEAIETGKLLLETHYPENMGDIAIAPLQISRAVRMMFAKRNPNNLSLMRQFNRSLHQLKANRRDFTALVANTHNQIALSRAVALMPLTGSNQIVAYEDAMQTRRILLPRGSKALIKQWPAQYLTFHSHTDNSAPSLVRVELLNGPASIGKRQVYIEGGSIVLPDPSR